MLSRSFEKLSVCKELRSFLYKSRMSNQCSSRFIEKGIETKTRSIKIRISQSEDMFSRNHLELDVNPRFAKTLRKEGAVTYFQDDLGSYIFGRKFNLSSYRKESILTLSSENISIVDSSLKECDRRKVERYSLEGCPISEEIYCKILFSGKLPSKTLTIYIHMNGKLSVDGIIIDSNYLFGDSGISEKGRNFDRYDDFPCQEDITFIGRRPESWDLDSKIQIPSSLSAFKYFYEAGQTLNSVRRWFILPSDFVITLLYFEGDTETLTLFEYKKNINSYTRKHKVTLLNIPDLNIKHNKPLISKSSLENRYIYNNRLEKNETVQERLNGKIIRTFKLIESKEGFVLKVVRTYE